VTDRILLSIKPDGERRHPTGPARPAPGTIRADHALDVQENTVYGPGSPGSADRETKIFFPDLV
jgi:nucleoside diphosphate kinase